MTKQEQIDALGSSWMKIRDVALEIGHSRYQILTVALSGIQRVEKMLLEEQRKEKPS